MKSIGHWLINIIMADVRFVVRIFTVHWVYTELAVLTKLLVGL